MVTGLFPQGKAWEAGEGSTLDNLKAVIADEFLRIGNRAIDLLNEADPRTTFEMVEDWERVLALPDDCTGPEATIEERRNQIVYKLTLQGGQSKQFFKDLALTLGYVVDIEEYDQFHVGNPVQQPLFGQDWMHAFGVIAPLNSLRPFRVNVNTVSNRLVEFGDDVFECLITKAKPSHSVVLFIYQ